MAVDVSHEAFQVLSSSEEQRRGWFGRLQAGPLAFRMRTRRLEVEPHGGPFSIKTVFRGRETYTFEHRQVRVAPGEMLIAAAGTVYGSFIDTPVETDSFSVFVPAHLLSAKGDGPVGRFLDGGLGAMNFVGQPCLHEALAGLARALETGDGLAIDEGFAGLLDQLGVSCNALGAACETIDAGTPARRAELLRRVLRVKALIDADPVAPHALADLSAIACLSAYHLLRVFKSAFGQTPAQYLASRRMARAARLLGAEPRQGIAAIARDCGYADPSAFGRAFRRHWGCAPAAFAMDAAAQAGKIARSAERIRA